MAQGRMTKVKGRLGDERLRDLKQCNSVVTRDTPC